MNGLSPLVRAKDCARFPKSARLLTSKDFKFKKYKKIRLENFLILVEDNGRGRLGISIAKKVLKRSVWRNRVRRLIKEAFRTEQELLKDKNLHVIAQPRLLEDWDRLGLSDMKAILKKAVQ